MFRCVTMQCLTEIAGLSLDKMDNCNNASQFTLQMQRMISDTMVQVLLFYYFCYFIIFYYYCLLFFMT